jgi:hypothetical protein
MNKIGTLSCFPSPDGLLIWSMPSFGVSVRQGGVNGAAVSDKQSAIGKIANARSSMCGRVHLRRSPSVLFAQPADFGSRKLESAE